MKVIPSYTLNAAVVKEEGAVAVIHQGRELIVSKKENGYGVATSANPDNVFVEFKTIKQVKDWFSRA